MEIRTFIGKGGRLVIPAKMRKALDISPGDEVILRIDDGQIRMIPLSKAIELAQQHVRQYIPERTSLVDELIQKRREEAKGE
ncbi:MAG: AbrB/MazE/SpoVT family DNA-binding domain-containing protein [Anaerolineales bacterium]|nr:AbrB/MazE/SpoVT family DNA-binding domain-containing protein [Anaerolineales bacterium]